MSSCAQGLVDACGPVASPPLVYNRLLQVINHPRSGSADIARVIGEDPALTGRLLRVVNSAFYSFPQPVGDVTHAVTVVGTSQIRDLALATSVMSMFQGIPSRLVDLESFWYHSLACGVLARVIAARRGEDNVERFFVAGILHDIGHLITYLVAGDRAHEAILLAAESGLPFHACEREVLGCDHTQVGRALLEKWNFPGSFREGVAYHHAPMMASRYPLEACAVHVAEVTAHIMEWGRSGDPRVPPFDPAAWDMLGLDTRTVPLILSEAEVQLQAAAHFMGGDA